MTEREIKVFREELKTKPKEHPFEYAKLCKSYCFDDTPTYVAKPAYHAFTYPTYDVHSQCFFYKHYDMEHDSKANEVSRDLIDLIDGFDGDIKNKDFIGICKLFNIPKEHVDSCLSEYLKNRLFK